MARSFFVTFSIDTEPDNQWEDFKSCALQNIDWLEPLQALFAEHGVKPTYLVTHSVATNEKAVKKLLRLTEFCPTEIGAHMHPWDNEPFSSKNWDREYQVFPHDLPDDLFEAKLDSLTSSISDAFPPPRSYRAGRFGWSAEHIRILESRGFVVDCSVTPLFDRRMKVGLPREQGGRGGRDFRNAPLVPYHPDYRDECAVGQAELIEVPVTSGTSFRVAEKRLHQYSRLPLLARRVLSRTGLMRVITASPTQYPQAEITRMVNVALDLGAPIVNFTFHSSEVMPGGSPRSVTQDAVDALLRSLTRIIESLRQREGCTFECLTAAAVALGATGRVRSAAGPP